MQQLKVKLIKILIFNIIILKTNFYTRLSSIYKIRKFFIKKYESVLYQ